jgi:hypothetical protein
VAKYPATPPRDVLDTSGTDRDFFAYTENTTDSGIDRRVSDLIAQTILNSILSQLQAGLTASPGGLTTGGKITEVTLNSSSWVALPPTALTDRNGMGLQNPNATAIKLNFDNTEPGYVGWRIAPNGETFLDVKDSIIVYAKAEVGNPTLVVMEIA